MFSVSFGNQYRDTRGWFSLYIYIYIKKKSADHFIRQVRRERNYSPPNRPSKTWMRQIAFKLRLLQSVIMITIFFFLKIINYSNKLHKKEADFKTQIYIFFHSVKKHLRFCNCHVNIHEPLVPQPTRAEKNWCIFYRRPWHVHCYHGAERLWKGRDAQGVGVFDRGGGGLGTCHSEGSKRDRSVG